MIECEGRQPWLLRGYARELRLACRFQFGAAFTRCANLQLCCQAMAKLELCSTPKPKLLLGGRGATMRSPFKFEYVGSRVTMIRAARAQHVIVFLATLLPERK